MRKYIALIVGIFTVAAGINLLFGISKMGKAKTQGTVLSATEQMGRRSNAYKITYAFQDTKGGEYTGEGTVSFDIRPGDPITVYYNASDPTDNLPSQGKSDLLFGALFLLVSAWAVFRFFRMRRAEAEAAAAA